MDDQNAFIGQLTKPTDKELERELGPSKAVWDELLADLEKREVNAQEWKSYSSKSGWALAMLRKKRTIVRMAPCHKYFLVGFILGEKAVKAARESKLSAKALKLIDEAPRYPEGTGVRIRVKARGDLALIRKLTVIKLGN